MNPLAVLMLLGGRGLIVPLGVAELPLLCRAVGLLSADVDGARCGCWCSLFWCLGGSHWVGLLLSVSLVVYSLLRCLSGHPWGWPVWCCGIPWHAEHGHLLGRVVSGLCGTISGSLCCHAAAVATPCCCCCGVGLRAAAAGGGARSVAARVCCRPGVRPPSARVLRPPLPVPPARCCGLLHLHGAVRAHCRICCCCRLHHPSHPHRASCRWVRRPAPPRGPSRPLPGG